MNQWNGWIGRLAGAVMNWMNADMAREAIERLSLRDDAEVLEVGFGGGRGLQMLASHVLRGKVHGVDPSPDMLRVAARKNRQAIEDGRVRLYLGSLDTAPLVEGSIDAIVVINTLQLVGELPRFMDRCAALLRGKGRFVALTHRWAVPPGSSPSGWSTTVVDVLLRSGFTDVAAWSGSALSGATLGVVGTRLGDRTDKASSSGTDGAVPK
jgi:ubiquinone/menaquinone biosynthesis C-methylase UbiE